jgi:Fur family transcriptional regulator, ferric uptake regulator
MDLTATTSMLARHGFKQTKQRRAVLEVLEAAGARMTAAQIYAEARRRCPDLGLPTVYRTLEILERVRAIRRVHIAGNCEGFAPASLADGHHIVCVKCGRVAEFGGCNVADLIPAATSQTGFRVEEHFLELLGTCGECSEVATREATSREARQPDPGEGGCAC